MAAATLVAILGLTLVAAALILWRLPVGTCSQCTHCALERAERERAAEDQAARFYGIPRCRGCGRYHTSEEPHRR